MGSNGATTGREWSLGAVLDLLATQIGERDMLVMGDERRTYAQVADRSRRLGGYLASRGIGLRTERAELQRWECGQSPIAIVMHNRPEYIEALYGAFRARATPFNANHHYRPGELASLFDHVGADAVVYERRLGPLVAATLAERAGTHEGAVLIEVDDGSEVASLDGAIAYETAIAQGDPDACPKSDPDDLYVVCTGGTTGLPKAVLWRQADLFVAATNGPEGGSAEDVAAAAINGSSVWLTAAPLMHAAAQWTVLSAFHGGNTVVFHDDSRRFDAEELLAIIERERVNLISIVGDAFARPLIEALRTGRYDASSLFAIGTGGAITSEDAKQELFALLPDVMIIDGYGASETGGMAFGARTRDGEAAGFAPSTGAVVLSEDRTRLLEPGEPEVGWTARRGRVPLGYLDDRAATLETFPEIDGERFAVPGDRARLDALGSIELLGRDSMVINTGGEKVFVEEVEEVLRSHPAVADALVVGRPSERFGAEVVGVVELHDGAKVDPSELREHCASALARFKAPRAIAVVERIGRHPSGKPDYRWAKDAAADALDATLTTAT